MFNVDTVHIWRIRLEVPDGATARMAAMLSADERARLGSYTSERSRSAFLCARAATRAILGEHLDRPPADIRLRTGRWGKPEVAGEAVCVEFSLSHAGGFALLAVTGPRAVGVDIEHASPGRRILELAVRYFPAGESRLVSAAAPDHRAAAFLRLWTRKEACVKAAGGRLAQGLHLPVAGHGRELLVGDPTPRLPGPWRVRDVTVPAGYAAAVAMAGATPYRIVSQHWNPERSTDRGGGWR